MSTGANSSASLSIWACSCGSTIISFAACSCCIQRQRADCSRNGRRFYGIAHAPGLTSKKNENPQSPAAVAETCAREHMATAASFPSLLLLPFRCAPSPAHGSLATGICPAAPTTSGK